MNEPLEDFGQITAFREWKDEYDAGYAGLFEDATKMIQEHFPKGWDDPIGIFKGELK